MKYLLLLVTCFLANLIFGQCNPSSIGELNINNIRCSILGAGDLWWDGVNDGQYYYPNTPTSSTKTIFAGGLWASGISPSGDLKLSAMTYRNQGFDFFIGPINSVTGQANQNCTFYDQHWEVLYTTIDQHIINYNAGTFLPIAPSIRDWPGKGNTYHAQNGVNITEDLAPFEDSNNNGIYDPENGDYPKIKGDQAIFCVFNDLGVHALTGGDPMGIEVHLLAYAYSQPGWILDNTTFYDYKIINKQGNALFDCKFSWFVDGDLGDFQDDYIGCDTTNNYGYSYNGNAIDAQLGSNPPIQVQKLIESSFNAKLNSFSFFNNGSGSVQTDPNTAGEFRNYQNGSWLDGSPIQFGGNGINTGSNAVLHVFPGNPALCTIPTEWSECNSDNNVTGACVAQAPNDRRYLMTFGPTDMLLGAEITFTLAAITVPTQNYSGCVNTDVDVTPAVVSLQTVYDDSLKIGYFYTETIISSISSISASDISLYPNPINDLLQVKVAGDIELSKIELLSITGQLVNTWDGEARNLDVAALAPSVYLLQLTDVNQATLIQKIVVN